MITVKTIQNIVMNVYFNTFISIAYLSMGNNISKSRQTLYIIFISSFYSAFQQKMPKVKLYMYKVLHYRNKLEYDLQTNTASLKRRALYLERRV